MMGWRHVWSVICCIAFAVGAIHCTKNTRDAVPSTAEISIESPNELGDMLKPTLNGFVGAYLDYRGRRMPRCDYKDYRALKVAMKNMEECQYDYITSSSFDEVDAGEELFTALGGEPEIECNYLDENGRVVSFDPRKFSNRADFASFRAPKAIWPKVTWEDVKHLVDRQGGVNPIDAYREFALKNALSFYTQGGYALVNNWFRGKKHYFFPSLDNEIEVRYLVEDNARSMVWEAKKRGEDFPESKARMLSALSVCHEKLQTALINVVKSIKDAALISAALQELSPVYNRCDKHLYRWANHDNEVNMFVDACLSNGGTFVWEGFLSTTQNSPAYFTYDAGTGGVKMLWNLVAGSSAYVITNHSEHFDEREVLWMMNESFRIQNCHEFVEMVKSCREREQLDDQCEYGRGLPVAHVAPVNGECQ